jgi:hypothetical protein
MNQALCTTAYFAPISYFVLAQQYGAMCFEMYENYQKQSYRNRCQILGPNGMQSLTVPVVKTEGNHSAIAKVTLQTPLLWRKQHWQSLLTAYNSSPYFLYYSDEIETVLFADYKNLWQLNLSLNNLMLDLLQMSSKTQITVEFEAFGIPKNDFRLQLHPKKEHPILSLLQQNPYIQVFGDRFSFQPNLSILDLLFNLGPESKSYLNKIANLHQHSE